jgi:hypothetical protein
MTTINLHIDRLVLDGLPVAGQDGPLIGAAVETELARLLERDGEAARFVRDRAHPVLRADPIPGTASGQDPLGAQIGRAVHGAVGR